MKHLQRQQGAVLVTSLIILLVLTVITVSGMQSSIMQEKMTSAIRDSNVSLESAETALREAEAFIETLVNTSDFNGADGTSTNGLYQKGEAPDAFAEAAWTGSNSIVSTTDLKDSDINPPRYYIELLGEISSDSNEDINVTTYGAGVGEGSVTGFRVVARGTGKSGTSQRVLTSFYGKRM